MDALEKRLREMHDNRHKVCSLRTEDAPHAKCWLMDDLRAVAEIEREECDKAAAGAGDVGDRAFERGAKIRAAIRARGGK